MPVEPLVYRRGWRVVCRTQRGLEVGQVLGEADRPRPGAEPDGQLIRPMTVEDDLLWSRLERRKHEALDACADLLRSRSLDAALVDVEPLFDGRSLFFYFLGEVSPEVAELTDELAGAYESQARLESFAATLEAGCGPLCGTAEASGCGSGGCSTCSLVAACQKPHDH